MSLDGMGTDDHAERLRRALQAIRKLQARVDELEGASREPIAVVGMACRFPGEGSSPDAFWRLLHEGVDAVVEIPRSRFDLEAIFDPDPTAVGKTYVRHGAMIDDIDLFDPSFFGISPREAVAMDPQHRVLLEQTWKALEDARVQPATLAGTRTGVFVGITGSGYAHVARESGTDLDGYHSMGTNCAFAAGRISYTLGLEGPSISLDTACSSSLVALHLACRSLRARESDLAVAAGVQVMVAIEEFVTLAKARMLSPDGRCHTFDARANGFVRGEGCGVVVLKRLSDARRDGDRIWALVRGTAVNQDGASSGLTVPNRHAQEAVIRDALAASGVEGSAIGYVEAHGTGTPLGDPIELRALGAVLGKGRAPDAPFLVGSVKSNFGHLEAAAGIAGFMKAVLAVHHGEVPPSLHFHEPNPHIPWDQIPAVVPTAPTPWPHEGRRLAGVSSFGASGTNAHVIVEAWREVEPTETDTPNPRPMQLLTVSARSDEELAAQVDAYRARLRDSSADSAADLCHAASTTRTHFSHRVGVVGVSRADLAEALGRSLEGEEVRDPSVSRGVVRVGEEPRIGLLFTGQGAQYAGMAAALREHSRVFRESLDECAALATEHMGTPLLDVVLGRVRDADSLLAQTGYTQPALFAVEYALARLWLSIGVKPVGLLGHSVGEIAAACLAGVFTLPDAVRFVVERGRLMQALPSGGAMTAVLADAPVVSAALRASGTAERVSIAALNGPANTVVSGPADAVAELSDHIRAKGIEVRSLKVSHAFHSSLMEPALAGIEAVVGGMRLGTPAIRLVSNVSGAFEDDAFRRAGYWSRHAREGVRFADGVRALAEAGCDTFLEVGPHPVLLGMAAPVVDGAPVRWLPSLRRGADEWGTFLKSVAELHVAGATIDFAALDDGVRRRRVSLPTYPFRGTRFWVTGSASRAQRGLVDTGHPLLGGRFDSAGSERVFQVALGLDALPWLGDHRLFGRPLFPVAAYAEAARAAGVAALGREDVAVRDLIVGAPLFFDEAEPTPVQVVVSPDGAGRVLVRVASRDGDGWRDHVTATVVVAGPEGEAQATDAKEPEAARQPVDLPAFYERFSGLGLEFGPAFRNLRALGRWERTARAEIELARDLDSTGYRVHPVVLDACLQSAGVLLPEGDTVYVPVGIERVEIQGEVPTELECVATLRGGGGERGTAVADVTGFDESGRAVVVLEGVSLRPAPREAISRAQGVDDLVYDVVWQEAGTPAEPSGSAGAGRWVVVADEGGTAAALVSRLEELGGVPTMVACPERLDELETALVGALGAPGDATVRGVVMLAALDEVSPAPTATASAATLEEGVTAAEAAHARVTGMALHTVRALATSGVSAPLWLVTRGSQDVGLPEEVPDPAQAGLWGFARVAMREHPELSVRCVDLPASGRDDGVHALTRWLTQPTREDQISIRRGRSFVARVVRRAAGSAPTLEAPTGDYRIASRGDATLDNLVLESLQVPEPGPGEIQVEVRAAGLGFRDVLNALGAYPGGPVPYGSELVGVVTKVGPGVTRHSVGDRVMGGGFGTFQTVAITHEAAAARVPDSMTLTEAATIPSAFLTAWRGLFDLAHLSKGERVLIHSGAGGVGLAAVQMALDAGAEVFATAGSEAKRELLRELGVQHALDSRTLEFGRRIQEITNGEGVDVILNALTGDFIEVSVGALGASGRFVELGKRDIWDPQRMRERRPDVEYHILDLAEVMRREPEVIGRTFGRILHGFERGAFRPLPLTEFPFVHAPEAFRYMAQARHVGKVVLTPRAPAALDPSGTYLITGGLGGLGLAVAERFIERGARRLLLASRAEPSPAQAEAIEGMRREGADVRAIRADIAEPDDVLRLVRAVAADSRLRGVIHAAAVIDDGVIVQQDAERMRLVHRPKVCGAWLLDEVARDLDFFVCFSAGAALLGSPGQSGYAAANTYLDTLVLRRARRGGGAASIAWGPWSEVGLAARHGARMMREGIAFLSPPEGLAALEAILARPAGRAHTAVIRADWASLADERGGPALAPPLFAHLASAPTAGARASGARSAAPRGSAGKDVARQLAGAPRARRAILLATHVEAQVARALQLAPGTKIDPGQPLQEIGLDSLMAVELRTLLTAGLELRRPLSATVALDHPTVKALTSVLEQALFPDEPEGEDDGGQDAEIAAVSSLTEAEAEAALLAELDAAAPVPGQEGRRG